jgi:ankyrin repeat protein
MRGFASHFRLRSIDPTDQGACARFAKDYLDYFRGKPTSTFLNGADAHGMTPLMCALKGEDFDLVYDLKQHGAAVDVKLLKFAISHNAPDAITKYLFKNAEYPDKLSHDFGPLFDGICLLAERDRPLALECLKYPKSHNELLVHDAACCGHAAVIPILKDAGFDLNVWLGGMRGGSTPLMTSIGNGGASCHAVVEALLDAGADGNLSNIVGESPLTVARDHDLKAIAMLLERHGVAPPDDIEKWMNSDDQQS